MTSDSLASMDYPSGRMVEPSVNRPTLTHLPNRYAHVARMIVGYLVKHQDRSFVIDDVTQSEEVFYRSKLTPAESRQIIQFT